MSARPQFPPGGIALPVPSLHPVTLWLRRFVPDGTARGALLLLHGGNSSGDTFLVPEGGVTRVLVKAGWEVWILEWRSSPYVVDEVLRHRPALGGSVINECRRYTFDQVVTEDLPQALAKIRGLIGPGLPLAVVGHCLGAGMAALACARGTLEPFAVEKLVLCTLGLFVEVPWNAWLKPEDFILERVLHHNPECRAIDPKRPEDWPGDFGRAYQVWPSAWLAARGNTSWEKLLERMSFMVGQPYSIDRLHESLRDDSIESFFGPMHLGLYLHAAQSVRRGYLAPFDDPDIIDRPRINPAHRRTPWAAPPPAGDLDPTFFRTKSVALIAAGQSRLWHRDAIDLMYEWLRGIDERAAGTRVTKQVFEGYGLQELFWGAKADEVYRAIRDALEPNPVEPGGRAAPCPPNGAGLTSPRSEEDQVSSAEDAVARQVGAEAQIEALAQDAWRRLDYQAVADTALRAYGGEIYTFVLAQFHGNAGPADEAFSDFSEDFWRGLTGFQWRCSIRAWCYKLARSACSRYRRSPHNRADRRAPVSVGALVDHIGHQARSSTQQHMRTEVKDKIRELREQLSPPDRDLLTLRVDRGMSWRDVVFAMHAAEDAPPDDDLLRLEAAMRQRFADVKRHLKQLAQAAGLL